MQFKLLDLIYHGFLLSVMASSLSQVGHVQISGSVICIFGNFGNQKVKKTNLCISVLFFIAEKENVILFVLLENLPPKNNGTHKKAIIEHPASNLEVMGLIPVGGTNFSIS